MRRCSRPARTWPSPPASQGRALGYGGKLCIHPAQVALAHEQFGPTRGEISRAQALLTAARDAARSGHGAFRFDGQLVDEPMLARARAVLHARPEHVDGTA